MWSARVHDTDGPFGFWWTGVPRLIGVRDTLRFTRHGRDASPVEVLGPAGEAYDMRGVDANGAL